jgi:transporter family-2 protein
MQYLALAFVIGCLIPLQAAINARLRDHLDGSTLLAPKIGVAKMAALVIAGQVALSLIADHFGWMGLAVREVDPVRAGGGLLVLAGVVLVNYDAIFAR